MPVARILLKLCVFWILFFIVQQFIFLGFNFYLYKGNAFSLFYSFWKAISLDISAGSYLIIVPVLMVIAGLFGLSDKWVNQVIRWETIIMIVLCTLATSADIGLYKVWGTKINAKALGYLDYPEEVFSTVFSIENLTLLVIAIAQVIFWLWVRKRITEPYSRLAMSVYSRIIFSVLAVGFCIIGFRGGVQKAMPINRNWVFHSEHAVLNYAALNSFWNIADLVFNPLEKQENPYVFFNPKTAGVYTEKMHESGRDSTDLILNTDTPNVVIIFLESWAADVIECLGGEKNVTPQFCKLAKDGLLFTQCYSTGFRTEQGYMASLSGISALPQGSLMKSFGKFDKLPNLYKSFKALGYETSFYTGGLLEFDNIEAYLRASGVNIVKGDKDWDIVRRTNWGAYDEEIFSMHLKEMQTMPQPFFSVFATMTTHEWFDADVPDLFKGDADRANDKYRNTMHYADSCLSAYFDQAKQEPWYKNTLYIVVADHSCMFPKRRNNFDTERHHIPLLITGGALKDAWRGKTSERVCSHVDLPATLLAQVHHSSADFPYSKNLFNRFSPAFAYYAFDNGFGLISKEGHLIYDHNQQKLMDITYPNTGLTRQWSDFGKAYLQVQYQKNLDYGSAKREE